MKSRLDLLLAWAEGNGRSYPWRSCRGFPLAVAEILLQKTRADAVEGTWMELTRLFPDHHTLAAASEGEIESRVAHLGLGRQRADRLLSMARSWGEARLPTDPLPGIGSYGRAVIEFSMGKKSRHVPVDGNIARVVSRVRGLRFSRGELRKKGEVREEVKNLLRPLAPTDALAAIYALVDLGAILCKPQKPLCGSCPFRTVCESAT